MRCRKLALRYYDDVHLVCSLRGDDCETIHIMKADIMRRAGLFEDLRQEYESAQYRKELFNQIIAFQLEKAAIGDRSCYTVNDVVSDCN